MGGVTAGAGNVISGNGSDGLIIAGVFLTCDPVPGGATGNAVQGNFIGTQVDGTAALGNGGNGVFVNAVSDTTIGATSASAGNVIASNGAAGVSVDSATSTAIQSNSIFSNTGLGIDLSPAGLTPNDAGDPDAGANNLQNSPDIASARLGTNGNMAVQYSVDSATGNSTYPLRIEFFKADADGEEGKTFLCSDSYPAGTAQGAMVAILANAAALGVGGGDLIVATATDADNNTSEFSQSAQVTAIATPVIPGLSEWGLIALAGLMAAAFMWRMRRRARREET